MYTNILLDDAIEAIQATLVRDSYNGNSKESIL